MATLQRARPHPGPLGDLVKVALAGASVAELGEVTGLHLRPSPSSP